MTHQTRKHSLMSPHVPAPQHDVHQHVVSVASWRPCSPLDGFQADHLYRTQCVSLSMVLPSGWPFVGTIRGGGLGPCQVMGPGLLGLPLACTVIDSCLWEVSERQNWVVAGGRSPRPWLSSCQPLGLWVAVREPGHA